MDEGMMFLRRERGGGSPTNSDYEIVGISPAEEWDRGDLEPVYTQWTGSGLEWR